jgi:DNA-directed RNA polymerase subunit beta
VKEIRSLALDIEPITEKKPEAETPAKSVVVENVSEMFANADSADDLIGGAPIESDEVGYELIGGLDIDKE